MNITAGKYKGQKVLAPEARTTRPTLSKTREAIFNVLYSLTDFEGKSFLDVFAGSGIMGLEALSRGFASTMSIEKNPTVANILKENYKKLGLQADLICKDSLKILPKLKKTFDIIYVDPPYLSGIYEKSLELIKTNSIADEKSIIILEHTTNINWTELGYTLIKQKEYSKKFITFLNIEDAEKSKK